MTNNKQQRLTVRQAEVLDALDAGEIITIDSMNSAMIGRNQLDSRIRYFLTQKRLVTRKDTSKVITAPENGYVITPKGRDVLLDHLKKD